MQALLRPVALLNTYTLRFFRQLAWIALALMVVVILMQVFFRYLLNNALAWPDEAARFLMLWMVGLIAPSAFRWNGFVAIDMLPRALPRIPAQILTMLLLLLSLTILVAAVGHGYNHSFGFGGRFDSSSLRLPLEWFGMDTIKLKLRYMYSSLLVCVLLLISVNIELILRAAIKLVRPGAELPDDDAPETTLEAD